MVLYKHVDVCMFQCITLANIALARTVVLAERLDARINALAALITSDRIAKVRIICFEYMCIIMIHRSAALMCLSFNMKSLGNNLTDNRQPSSLMHSIVC